MTHKSDVTFVAMATMTFRCGRYFGFKRILLEQKFGDPDILFDEIFS